MRQMPTKTYQNQNQRKYQYKYEYQYKHTIKDEQIEISAQTTSTKRSD